VAISKRSKRSLGERSETRGNFTIRDPSFDRDADAIARAVLQLRDVKGLQALALHFMKMPVRHDPSFFIALLKSASSLLVLQIRF
jgi:hypothetical protein